MLKCALFFLFSTSSLLSLEKKPWLGNLYELEGGFHYIYSDFNRVNRGVPPLKRDWHDHLSSLSLSATLPENWNWEVEIEGDATTRRSFGYSSAAVQGRYLWMDDLVGDPVSLTTGISLRQTSSISLHQLSTPYHARLGIELHAAVGKEWSRGSDWVHRLFGCAAYGKGNRGASWWHFDLFYLGNICDWLQGRLFLLNYLGNGKKKSVDLDHFRNWGKIAHYSIDLGGGVYFPFRPWGALRIEYARRLYARSYPEKVNFFLLAYEIPFSVF